MERMLEKMARQLNAYDEASLMQLWQQYAARANEFEPSKRWEEAVLVLSFIQAVRWKNQLFNYHFAATAASVPDGELPPHPVFAGNAAGEEEKGTRKRPTPGKKATRLRFPSRDGIHDQDS